MTWVKQSSVRGPANPNFTLGTENTLFFQADGKMGLWSLESEKLDWESEEVFDPITMIGKIVLLGEDKVVGIKKERDGGGMSLFAFEKESGEERWRLNLPVRPADEPLALWERGLVATGKVEDSAEEVYKVYWISEEGEVVAEFSGEETGIISGVAKAENGIYFSCYNGLFYAENPGELVQLNDEKNLSGIISNGDFLFCASNAGWESSSLICFNTSSNQVLTRIETELEMNPRFICDASGRVLVLASELNNLKFWDGTSGSLLWEKISDEDSTVFECVMVKNGFLILVKKSAGSSMVWNVDWEGNIIDQELVKVRRTGTITKVGEKVLTTDPLKFNLLEWKD